MTMKAIRTEAQLTSFRSRNDGSIGFSGCTPEMSSDEKVALFDLQNAVVEMLIYPKGMKDAELLQVSKNVSGQTPSQEFRTALWRLWKEGDQTEPFEKYYKNHLFQLTQAVLAKLSRP